MRKFTFGVLLMVILCNILVVSVYATSVAVETSITQNFYAVFTFSDINATIYRSIRSNVTANTVPTALYNNMVRKGYSGVGYSNQSINFNDTTYSIVSAFNLQGTSIINSTTNYAASTVTYQMNTGWRKFFLNVTTDFYFNFTQDFAQSLASWNRNTVGGITSYSYSNSTTGVSFSFQLPSDASSISASGDTLTFDVPYTASFEDNLISSPILILIALAVAGLIVYVYRRIKG